ncbi:MAG: hypothetical protein WC840_05450 [Candidatus Peribacteraceae bacterium]
MRIGTRNDKRESLTASTAPIYIRKVVGSGTNVWEDIRATEKPFPRKQTNLPLGEGKER